MFIVWFKVRLVGTVADNMTGYLGLKLFSDSAGGGAEGKRTGLMARGHLVLVCYVGGLSGMERRQDGGGERVVVDLGGVEGDL